METEAWPRRSRFWQPVYEGSVQLRIFSACDKAAIFGFFGQPYDSDPRPEQADNKDAREEDKKMKRL